MLKYWVWLSELKGLRNQTRLALLRRFGDPESIFYADPEELLLTEGIDPGQAKLLANHDLAPADKILADCQRLDIQLLTFSDAAYPGRLKNIYDPPALLYYKGRLPLLDDLLYALRRRLRGKAGLRPGRRRGCGGERSGKGNRRRGSQGRPALRRHDHRRGGQRPGCALPP